MFIEVPASMAWTAFTGAPVALITSRSAEGVDDVMANAWNMPFDMKPSQVCAALVISHTTTQNILATGKFGFCVPGTALQSAVLACGSCHGADVGDKFTHCNIAKIEGSHLPVPLVADALAVFECELLDRDLLASKGILMGEVVAARVNPDYWDEENGFVCKDRPQSTMHADGNYHFFTRGAVKSWSDND